MATSAEDIKLSAEYFKHITDTFVPSELFDSVDGCLKVPSRVSAALTNTVHKKIGNDFDDSASKMDLRQLLENGLEATREVVHGSFKASPDEITQLEASEIVNAPKTIYTLAALSLRHEDIGRLSYVLPGQYSITTKTKTDPTTGAKTKEKAITLSPWYQPSKTDGCPFAGKNGDVNYGAAFVNFAKFAGDLALRSYFYHFKHEKYNV